MNPLGACLKQMQEVIHLLQRYPAVEPPSLLLIKKQAQVEGLASPIGGGSVQYHTFSSASGIAMMVASWWKGRFLLFAPSGSRGSRLRWSVEMSDLVDKDPEMCRFISLSTNIFFRENSLKLGPGGPT